MSHPSKTRTAALLILAGLVLSQLAVAASFDTVETTKVQAGSLGAGMRVQNVLWYTDTTTNEIIEAAIGPDDTINTTVKVSGLDTTTRTAILFPGVPNSGTVKEEVLFFARFYQRVPVSGSPVTQISGHVDETDFPGIGGFGFFSQTKLDNFVFILNPITHGQAFFAHYDKTHTACSLSYYTFPDQDLFINMLGPDCANADLTVTEAYTAYEPLNKPTAMEWSAPASADAMLIVSSLDHHIREHDGFAVGSSKRVACSGVAGSVDGPALTAQCNNPLALRRYDVSTEVFYFYFTEPGCLRKWDPTTGLISTVIGQSVALNSNPALTDGTGLAASLGIAYSMEFYDANTLLVFEDNATRIRQIRTSGQPAIFPIYVPTEAPTTQAPTTEVPTTEVPTTEVPTTEVPTTEAPTTEVPTTTEVPPTTTIAPTTLPPTTTTVAPTTTEVPSTTGTPAGTTTTAAPSTTTSTVAPTTSVPSTTPEPTTTTEVPSTLVPIPTIPLSTQTPTTMQEPDLFTGSITLSNELEEVMAKETELHIRLAAGFGIERIDINITSMYSGSTIVEFIVRYTVIKPSGGSSKPGQTANTTSASGNVSASEQLPEFNVTTLKDIFDPIEESFSIKKIHKDSSSLGLGLFFYCVMFILWIAFALLIGWYIQRRSNRHKKPLDHPTAAMKNGVVVVEVVSDPETYDEGYDSEGEEEPEEPQGGAARHRTAHHSVDMTGIETTSGTSPMEEPASPMSLIRRTGSSNALGRKSSRSTFWGSLGTHHPTVIIKKHDARVLRGEKPSKCRTMPFETGDHAPTWPALPKGSWKHVLNPIGKRGSNSNELSVAAAAATAGAKRRRSSSSGHRSSSSGHSSRSSSVSSSSSHSSHSSADGSPRDTAAVAVAAARNPNSRTMPGHRVVRARRLTGRTKNGTRHNFPADDDTPIDVFDHLNQSESEGGGDEFDF